MSVPLLATQKREKQGSFGGTGVVHHVQVLLQHALCVERATAPAYMARLGGRLVRQCVAVQLAEGLESAAAPGMLAQILLALLLLVLLHVPLQRRSFTETTAADIAAVWPLSGVPFVVSLERKDTIKGLSTTRYWALVDATPGLGLESAGREVLVVGRGESLWLAGLWLRTVCVGGERSQRACAGDGKLTAVAEGAAFIAAAGRSSRGLRG